MTPGNLNAAYVPTGNFRKNVPATVIFSGGNSLNSNSGQDSAKVVAASGSCEDSPYSGISEVTDLGPGDDYATSSKTVTAHFTFTQAGQYKVCYKVAGGSYTEVGNTIIAGDTNSNNDMYACDWTTHVDKSSSGNACSDSTEYTTLLAGKLKCLEFGPSNCKGVTLGSNGKYTLRSSATLSTSTGETTYTVDCGTSCRWTAVPGTSLSKHANNDDTTYNTVLEAQAQCESLGPYACVGITCSDAGVCGMRGTYPLRVSGSSETSYIMRCGTNPTTTTTISTTLIDL